MNKFLTPLVISAILAFSISSAIAEETSTNKKYSIDITVPDNNNTFVGGRMFIDSETAIEVMGTAQLLGKDNDAGLKGGTQIIASGGIMKYINHGRVSPYLRAGGTVALYFGDRFTNKDNDLQGYAGVGAEFMFTDELSLRASVNAILAISPFQLTTTSSDLNLSFLF